MDHKDGNKCPVCSMDMIYCIVGSGDTWQVGSLCSRCRKRDADLLPRSVLSKKRIRRDDLMAIPASTSYSFPRLTKPPTTKQKPNPLRSMPYKDYLKTEHWQRLRRAVLAYADYKCQLCESTERLSVHHRTYERRGSELLSDVIVLCTPCHAKFHDKVK